MQRPLWQWVLLACGLLWGVAGVAHGAVLQSAQSRCAATANDAAALYVQPWSAAVNARAEGFRVEREWADPLDGSRWLVIARCGERAGPAQLRRIASAAGQGARRAAAPVLLHAGDAVELIDASDGGALRLSAEALDNAAAGEPVRVRLRVFGAGTVGRIVRAEVLSRGEVRWLR